MHWWQQWGLRSRILGDSSHNRLEAIGKLEQSDSSKATELLMMAWEEPIVHIDAKVAAICALEKREVKLPQPKVRALLKKAITDSSINWRIRRLAADTLEKKGVQFDKKKVLFECHRAELEEAKERETKEGERRGRRQRHRCSILGLHSWDGCKCSGCAKTRDAEHKWGIDEAAFAYFRGRSFGRHSVFLLANCGLIRPFIYEHGENYE